MVIEILRKEDVVDKDPINMEVDINRSIIEDDARIEQENELLGTVGNNGESRKQWRE